MASSSTQLRALVQEVDKAVGAYEGNSDPAAYRSALAAVKKLHAAIEKPMDLCFRTRYQALPNIALVMLAEAGVLKAIAAHKGEPTTASELAKETGCDSFFITRLMRLLAGVGIFEYDGDETFRSNAQSDLLSEPSQLAGLRFMLKVHGPIGSKAEQFVRDKQSHTATYDGTPAIQYVTGLPYWELLERDASIRQNFNQYQSQQAKLGGQAPPWARAFPPAARLRAEDLAAERGAGGEPPALFVDVGGGAGLQAAAFRREFPDLPGRCVLQDLPSTIEENPTPPEGVECMAYDFFTPQPVKGARFYYFRGICHDWPDADCVRFLRNTVDAMAPGRSRLLVCEMVVGVDAPAATTDLQMYLLFNGKERTEPQWRALLRDAGLRVVAIHPSPGAPGCIIETEKDV